MRYTYEDTERKKECCSSGNVPLQAWSNEKKKKKALEIVILEYLQKEYAWQDVKWSKRKFQRNGHRNGR